jgi:glycosyltransferase involved in cell wall biosynthesis
LADPAALAAEMAAAAVVAYPSLAVRGETFGIVPLEAAAAGTPSVVSDLPVFRGHVLNERTGLTFDHTAPDAADRLASQLRRVLTDRALAARLSAAGSRHAENYAPDRIAAMHLDDFRTLLDRPGA